MSTTRRLRSLLIALTVLALSATVVLAGRPIGHGPKQPDAKIDVPSGSEAPGTEAYEAPDTDAPKATEEPDDDARPRCDRRGGHRRRCG